MITVALSAFVVFRPALGKTVIIEAFVELRVIICTVDQILAESARTTGIATRDL
jgi:rRNA-processing protein FCF1